MKPRSLLPLLFAFAVAPAAAEPVLVTTREGLEAIAENLAALAGETPPIPVPATVDAATGRAVLDLDFGLYLQALGAPAEFTPSLPDSLFARPVLTPVRPDLQAFILVIEP